MDYETSCMYCYYSWWNSNNLSWECILHDKELSTDYDGDDLYEMSCEDFKG